MTEVTAVIGRDRYKTELLAGSHLIIADEPLADGGADLGPAPYQLLLSALGACTVMTLRSYADLKGLPVDRITAELTMQVKDVDGKRHTYINRHLIIEGDVEEKMLHRMTKIAEMCPVHRVLSSDIQIHTRLNN